MDSYDRTPSGGIILPKSWRSHPAAGLFRRAGQPPGYSGKLLLGHSSEAGAAGVSWCALFHCENDHLEAYDLFVHRKSFPRVTVHLGRGAVPLVPEDKSVGEPGRAAIGRRCGVSAFHRGNEPAQYFFRRYISPGRLRHGLVCPVAEAALPGAGVLRENLYVKGACYRAMDEAMPPEAWNSLHGKHKITCQYRYGSCSATGEVGIFRASFPLG